jgi:hypothetical protein
MSRLGLNDAWVAIANEVLKTDEKLRHTQRSGRQPEKKEKSKKNRKIKKKSKNQKRKKEKSRKSMTDSPLFWNRKFERRILGVATTRGEPCCRWGKLHRLKLETRKLRSFGGKRPNEGQTKDDRSHHGDSEAGEMDPMLGKGRSRQK